MSIGFIRLSTLLGILWFLTACVSERIEIYQSYRADFDPAIDNIKQAEEVMYDIAERWSLEVYEKSRFEARAVNSEHDAFFIELHLEEIPIATITNIGGEVILIFDVFESEVFPTVELDKLVETVIRSLEQKVNIDFKRNK